MLSGTWARRPAMTTDHLCGHGRVEHLVCRLGIIAHDRSRDLAASAVASRPGIIGSVSDDRTNQFPGTISQKAALDSD
jgi:hypothetical protein